MGKLFDSVQFFKPKTAKFDLSHERKFSMDMGNLVPIMVQDVLPGDRFRVKTEIFMRMAPMLAPIMHRVNVKTDFFYVPNRLIWSEWEEFITGGRLGTSTPFPPYFTMADLQSGNGISVGSLGDFLGLPFLSAAPAVGQELNVSALPFRAYQLIYDEYYRDQNLTPSLDLSMAGGNIPPGAEFNKLIPMRNSCWEKDYFTSALPFAQRGPAVSIPVELGGDAPIHVDPVNDTSTSATASGIEQDGGPLNVGWGVNLSPGEGPVGGANMWARIAGLTSSTNISELRRSIKLQEWLEAMARGGARYAEQLKVIWGQRPSDARLQRPEYLGGGRSPMQISEVLSSVQQVDPTSGDPVGTPQGDMAGHGISMGNQNGFSRRFEEHGYVIGIIRVLPKTAYQQGIPRHWTRFDKFDYPWPQFAQIGEQEVRYKELFYDHQVAPFHPDSTFGYQSRYAECKYGCSSVHGVMKNDLSFWHMGRIFTAQPALSESFVISDPTTRIFAVDDAPATLYCHLHHKVDAVRPLPYFGTPTI